MGAVRYGDWKLLEFFESGDLELYNLRDDIGEKKNLASAHPEKVKQLRGLMEDWRQETKAPVPREKNPNFDANAEKAAIAKILSRG